MTVCVRESTETSVRMMTGGGWAAPSLSILSPSGSAVAGGTATLDSASSTVNGTASVGYQWDLADATGFEVGRWYAVTTAGVLAVCQITAKAGNSVVVDPAPIRPPSDGDPVVGVEVVVTVPAIAERGHGYQLILTDGDKESREGLDVVRRLFLTDYRDTDMRRKLAEAYPAGAMTEVAIDGMVATVREEIRQLLLERGAYPTEWVDPSVFRELGHAIASRLLAVRRGLYPMGVGDREAYLTSVAASESRYLTRVINSYQARDQDADGEVDKPTVRRFVGKKSR